MLCYVSVITSLKVHLVVYNFDDDVHLENGGTAHRIAKTH